VQRQKHKWSLPSSFCSLFFLPPNCLRAPAHTHTLVNIVLRLIGVCASAKKVGRRGANGAPGSFARGLRAKMRFVIQKQRGKRQKQRDQSASHPQSVGSAAFCIIREAGWLAGSSWREGGVHMVARRPLAHSAVPLLLHTPTDWLLGQRNSLALYCWFSSLSHAKWGETSAAGCLRAAVGRAPPQQVRVADDAAKQRRRAPDTFGLVQCTSGAAPAFRQPTCVPINSAPTRRQCRTYCSAKLTRRRREN
jgi:hypothetical protein